MSRKTAVFTTTRTRKRPINQKVLPIPYAFSMRLINLTAKEPAPKVRVNLRPYPTDRHRAGVKYATRLFSMGCIPTINSVNIAVGRISQELGRRTAARMHGKAQAKYMK
jgi:hypothetical protein